MKRRQHEPKLRTLVMALGQDMNLNRKRLDVLEAVVGLIVSHPDTKHIFERPEVDKPETIQ